jgi:hypothetical protein
LSPVPSRACVDAENYLSARLIRLQGSVHVAGTGGAQQLASPSSEPSDAARRRVFGWLVAGWALTWAAVELGMLQRLLDTVSLSGGQWLVALGLSLLAPAFVGIDKAVRLRRLGRDPEPAPVQAGVP